MRFNVIFTGDMSNFNDCCSKSVKGRIKRKVGLEIPQSIQLFCKEVRVFELRHILMVSGCSSLLNRMGFFQLSGLLYTPNF